MSIFEELEEVLKKHDKVMKQTAYGTFEIHDKPEPSVIIKKSGETWVARYDCVDWLCVEPGRAGVCVKYMAFNEYAESWKPISSITITDEIAKLRPMVKRYNRSPEMLIAVLSDGTYTDMMMCGENYRLATATDLTNQE